MSIQQQLNEENKTGGIKQFLISGIGKITLTAILYFVILGLTSLFFSVFDDLNFIGFIIIAVMAYFGWQALKKITPDIFLIMPIGGWLIYFVIKGILALIIGIFVAPYVISKRITATIQESII